METANSTTAIGTVTMARCHSPAHECQSVRYDVNQVEAIQKGYTIQMYSRGDFAELYLSNI
jgi:hypothetical protein